MLITVDRTNHDLICIDDVEKYNSPMKMLATCPSMRRATTTMRRKRRSDELANFKICDLHEISYQNSSMKTHINGLECIFL
jgi:hypothetical protein